MRERIRIPIPNMGANLIAVRKELGLTQKKFANKFKLSCNSLSRMENNHSELTFYTLYRLWDEFHVNPFYLLKGHEPIFLTQEEKKNSSSNELDRRGFGEIILGKAILKGNRES